MVRGLLIAAAAAVVLATPPAAAQYDQPAAVKAAGKAKDVTIRFFINSLHAVDSVAETYEVDYYLLMMWDDPTVTSAETDWSKIWQPKVDSINAVNPGKQWEDFRMIRPGRVYSIARYATTYKAPMDLRRFPYDRQLLPLVFESSTYRVHELQFLYETEPGHAIRPTERPTIVPNDVALSGDIHLPEWVIDRVNVRERVNEYSFDNHSRWAQFRIELEVSRKYGFYVWRVFAIEVLIVLLSWLVFLHDAADIGSRMSFSLTLFLAAVAFSFVTAGLIPRISYLTVLDHYMFASYVLIFLTVIENVVVYHLQRRSGELAARIDRWLFVLFPLLFFAVTYLLLGRV